MAVIAWTKVDPPSPNQPVTGVIIIQWILPASGDSGVPYLAPQYSGKVVQISGTAGAGDIILMEGSLDPGASPGFGTLHDPQGNDISLVTADITAKKLEQVLEDCYQIRPRMTAGTAVNVVIQLMITTSARR